MAAIPESAVLTWPETAEQQRMLWKILLCKFCVFLGVSALGCGGSEWCGDGASVCWVREELLLLWMEIQVLVSRAGLAFPSSTAGAGSAWELLC